ncbi:MAG TPA: M20/M25/M40 family metallo-hydrolase [Planctomycetota bacterium]|nr:M20/M25/M40 family metallo-hydrolase [Planctomycetota bacterium]
MRREVSLRDEFLPLVGSPVGSFSGEGVFVGYGITAPECAWDDYAGVDVRGKVAVALRHEPFVKDDGATAWLGKRLTRHATFESKARVAAEHGAVGLVVVPDLASYPRGAEPARMPGRRFWLSLDPTDLDAGMVDSEELTAGNVSPADMVESIHYARQGPDLSRRLAIPSVFLGAGAYEPLLDPAAEERAIEKARGPRSRPLEGARISATVAIEASSVATANVVGRLPGSDPVLARENVVIGAHYDHMGIDAAGRIWHGADDNASGTAAILELAAALGSAPPKRSIVFVAFGAEEVMLLGSFHFVARPTVPLESIVAMVNLDMIGRGGEEDLRASPKEGARANQVFVSGIDSSPALTGLLAKANEGIDLEITPNESMADRSDQAAFYVAGIPIVFLNTGEHGDYHRVTDTADRLNYAKATRVARLALRCARSLADLPERLPFVDVLKKSEAWAGKSRKEVFLQGDSTPFLERPDL